MSKEEPFQKLYEQWTKTPLLLVHHKENKIYDTGGSGKRSSKTDEWITKVEKKCPEGRLQGKVSSSELRSFLKWCLSGDEQALPHAS